MKKIVYILLVTLITASCNGVLEDMNKNIKSPEVVPGETLFSNAQKNLADLYSGSNVNINIFHIWAQYWTETTYTDEANYDVVNRTIPDNDWRRLYRDILMDLREASNIISAETYVLPSDIAAQANKVAIADILSVYTYQTLVDMFGDVPYTEALDITNTVPKYDDAAGIYTDLLARLNTDIANLDASNASYGGADLYYGGDVAKWLMFANSLKLKIGITLADADNAAAKTACESAAAGVFASSADNATLPYQSATPNTNPLWVDLVASGRKDFVATSTIIDKMLALNDPRISSYYTTVDTGNGVPIYLGGIYGASNPYGGFSHIGAKMEDPTLECVLLSYEEVEFYLAEAVERGYSVGGTAEDHYNNGVTASIEYWGGSAGDATTYLGQASVAYATAASTWQEKVGTQAWLALFNRGFVAWTEWRRLDFPVLNPPPGMTQADIPTRFTYPINEQTLNGDNYTSAASAVGGDLLTTKLFWDKY